MFEDLKFNKKQRTVTFLSPPDEHCNSLPSSGYCDMTTMIHDCATNYYA